MSFELLLVLFLNISMMLQHAVVESSVIFPAINIGDIVESEAVESIESSADPRPDALILVGDIMMARNVEILMNRLGSEYPFLGINFSDISENALLVGNFEGSIPAVHRHTPPNTMRFSVDYNLVSVLKDVGFTQLSLSNNHSLDYGNEGFSNTEQVLNNLDIGTFGQYEGMENHSIEFLEMKSSRIALIGIHTLAREPTESEISSALNFATERSDIQIIFVHWGEEYSLLSGTSQQRLARALVAHGADLIIGHHPHVVQDVDIIDGVPVFYSLGNYIFDQYFSKNTQIGLVLALNLNEEMKIKLYPVESLSNKSQPILMSAGDTANFLIDLSKRSDPLIAKEVATGTVILNVAVATSTKTAIIQ